MSVIMAQYAIYQIFYNIVLLILNTEFNLKDPFNMNLTLKVHKYQRTHTHTHSGAPRCMRWPYLMWHVI